MQCHSLYSAQTTVFQRNMLFLLLKACCAVADLGFITPRSAVRSRPPLPTSSITSITYSDATESGLKELLYVCCSPSQKLRFTALRTFKNTEHFAKVLRNMDHAWEHQPHGRRSPSYIALLESRPHKRLLSRPVLLVELDVIVQVVS